MTWCRNRRLSLRAPCNCCYLSEWFLVGARALSFYCGFEPRFLSFKEVMQGWRKNRSDASNGVRPRLK